MDGNAPDILLFPEVRSEHSDTLTLWCISLQHHYFFKQETPDGYQLFLQSAVVTATLWHFQKSLPSVLHIQRRIRNTAANTSAQLNSASQTDFHGWLALIFFPLMS